MRKLIILAALLFGCSQEDSSTGPSTSENTLQPGVYNAEFTYGGITSGLKMIFEHKFDADENYRGRVYLTDGAQSCLILEGMAKWSATKSEYSISAATVKFRDTCADEFMTEEMPAESTPIRNVTKDSFEEYMDWGDQPAEWIRFDKI